MALFPAPVPVKVISGARIEMFAVVDFTYIDEALITVLTVELPIET